LRRPWIQILLAGTLLFFACHGEESEAPAPSQPGEVVSRPRTVTLYFESPELKLAPEQRTLSLPEDDWAAAPLILTELVHGSANSSIPSLFPPDTEVKAVYFLPGGAAVVDLGGATLAQGWNTGSHGELMAVYSVVQTMVSNFEGLEKVRVLVDGQPMATLGGHVAIDRFLRPAPDLVVQP
jgi:hypothetical protein